MIDLSAKSDPLAGQPHRRHELDSQLRMSWVNVISPVDASRHRVLPQLPTLI
jgi:hypothetical protein